MAFKKKPNTAVQAEEEIKRCYDELHDKPAASLEAERITQNIERIRKAEEIRYGKKTKLDPNKVCETLLGTLVPTVIVVYAEKFKDVIVCSKVFSKIKFK